MKILNKITIKQLKMNKQRTIVTLIGVILSCSLMVGIGLLFSSVRKNLEDSIVTYSGDYHVYFDDVSKDEINLFKNNVKVKEYTTIQFLNYAKSDKNTELLEDEYFNIINMDDSFHKTFQNMKGRFPQNENEILVRDIVLKKYKPYLKIGDEITLKIGKRYFEGEELQTDELVEQETFETESLKTYKIVGTYEFNSYDQNYSSIFYNMYVTDSDDKNHSSRVYLKYKNVKNTYSETGHIANLLDRQELSEDIYENVTYNQDYLSISGQSRYGNYNMTIVIILGVILSLISIACIIVIYNSFQISVMERKKQLGIFSSVGATKSQLRKSVFLEAFMIALIGIPLGIIGGILGIKLTIDIVAKLSSSLFEIPFQFYIYPIFIVIPVIFMIVVIFLSAYFPAKRASKIQPIEAIRQNDDIKLEKKKIKTSKTIQKIFGIEGEIALKNMKRNRRKYRVTIVSLFISIVLFLTFSSLLKYGLYGVDTTFENVEYDGIVSVTAPTYEEMKPIFQRLKNVEGPNKKAELHWMYIITQINNHDIFTKAYRNALEETVSNNVNDFTVAIATIDENDYQELLKNTKASTDDAILINQLSFVNKEEKTRKTYHGKIFKQDAFHQLSLTCQKYNDTTQNYDYETCADSLGRIVMTDTVPYGLKAVITEASPTTFAIVVSNEKYQQLEQMMQEKKYHLITSDVLYLQGKKLKNIEKEVQNIIDENQVEGIYYENVQDTIVKTERMILAIKILLYGFIALVTLIGITSVYNTTVTSLALRRREFAMLRSVGMGPKGFRKMLFLESFFFIAKAFLYALPTSWILILIIHYGITYSFYLESILFPWKETLIAILFAYLFVLITTMYATKKVRKENILEMIREENI